jgi:hypothetical protein
LGVGPDGFVYRRSVKRYLSVTSGVSLVHFYALHTLEQ